MSANRGGFTIVEVLIAMIILVVGLLAMLGSSALDTRAISRERNIDFAAIFAARRLEMLRNGACRGGANGADTLWRNSQVLATNAWTFTATRDSLTNLVDGYQIKLVNNYLRDTDRRRTDTLYSGISCVR